MNQIDSNLVLYEFDTFHFNLPDDETDIYSATYAVIVEFALLSLSSYLLKYLVVEVIHTAIICYCRNLCVDLTLTCRSVLEVYTSRVLTIRIALILVRPLTPPKLQRYFCCGIEQRRITIKAYIKTSLSSFHLHYNTHTRVTLSSHHHIKFSGVFVAFAVEAFSKPP